MQKNRSSILIPSNKTNKITLWTVQPIFVWEQLEKEGYYFTKKPLHVSDKDWDFFQWRMAYCWMVQEMRKRIGPPRKGIKWPTWAWYQSESSEKRKPDLRTSMYRYSGFRDERNVRIEIEIPRDKVLLSNFSTWHTALNYAYFGLTEKEDDNFYDRLKEVVNCVNKMPYPKPFHLELIKSWDKILQLGRFSRSKYVGLDTINNSSIQATFWEFSLDDVREVTFFGANKKIKTLKIKDGKNA